MNQPPRLKICLVCDKELGKTRKDYCEEHANPLRIVYYPLGKTVGIKKI